jgi:hypothetical protein
MIYVPGVHEGLAAASCGPRRYLGTKEGLGIVRLFCSDTLRVRLYQLKPVSPQVYLLESSWWRGRPARGADAWAWKPPSPWRLQRRSLSPCVTLRA